jgi:hypothetical protein
MSRGLFRVSFGGCGSLFFGGVIGQAEAAHNVVLVSGSEFRVLVCPVLEGASRSKLIRPAGFVGETANKNDD